MANAKIAYLELPASDPASLKRFYGTLFGWSFEDFGPDYVAVHEAGLEGGFNAEAASRTKAPLAMIETDEIEALEKKIQEAGGTITRPVFPYPGGRRFHFLDPGGNELAVMQPSPESGS